MGGREWRDLPVQVPVSDLELDPLCMSNGQRTAVIEDDHLAIGGGERGRAKLLQEVLVIILQVSLEEGPDGRLIGAEATTGAQPVRRYALLASPVKTKTAGTSAETTAPFCWGLQEGGY